MERTYCVILVFLCLSRVCADARHPDEMEHILRLTGASSAEQLDAEEVERLLNILEHPLDLNHSSDAVLTSSGLFTPYQVASLTDYRSRHGNILSYMELSAIDGFNADVVADLRPFVSLTANEIRSMNGIPSVHNDLSVRTSGKWLDGLPDCSYGMKYTMQAGQRLVGGLGLTRSYGGESYAPSAYTGNVQWNFSRLHGKVIAGDFNARFGQGLALWSGMLMDNVSSPSAMMRRASGLSRSASFTGSTALTGAALELSIGDFTLSTACAYPFLVLANLAWTCFNGRVSLTHVADGQMRTSADAALCFNGVNVFAESMYIWNENIPYLVAGTDFGIGENVRTGVQLKCLTDDMYSVAVSTSGHDDARRGLVTLSASGICYPEPKKGDEDYSVQVRGQLDCEYSFTERFRIKARVVERFRTWGNAFQTDVRADFHYVTGEFAFMSRVNVLKCEGLAGLTYLEAAWKPGNLSLYVRQGVFCVDDWDDRIYVYERDAPGSFNVPAMYGRGLWGNVVLSWKVSRRMKIYFRAAYTSYVFMEKKKPGKAELKLQSVFRF